MRAAAAIACAALAGCASSVAPDPGLEGLALTSVAPGTIVPGTKVVVAGSSFVDAQWGAGDLHLVGTANGQDVDVQWPLTFGDFSTMTVEVDAGKLAAVGGDVDFHGQATVEFVATSDDQTYKSDAQTVDLSFRTKLTPAVTGVVTGVIFVDDQIEVDGSGFLLGGDEGTTFARVAGCFQPDAGGDCAPVPTQDIAMQPMQAMSRTQAQFPFLPDIAGIESGTFTGTVTIVNKQTNAAELDAAAVQTTFTVVTSQVFSVDPPAASLGEYVFVRGGGFIGGEPGALTQIELTGTFTKTGGSPVAVDMMLVPQFVQGRLVQYVINTDDALGQALNLRTDTGSFTGTITPIVTWGNDTVKGVGVQAAFQLAPVKQVVYLEYETAYVEELRDYGLRALDAQIRARIVAACQDTYKGVNVEFRSDPPADFALFSTVDITGVDPNNMGLFGYDNTPGKDTGNLRLYDELGGVNTVTQQDGFPGFGGIFVRSFMQFSEHPGTFAQSESADPAFDTIFDPFRPDQAGAPVTADDLAGKTIAALGDGSSCPAKDRTSQIACAVFVLGSMIGDTVAHELGHSLGLADPYGGAFHDPGDQPNRLMDAGGDRPFLERAQLKGQGPGVFCTDEYTYLRQILPSADPANTIQRPGCQ